MKLLIVILAIGLLVLAYFWMGVALKFLLLWWMSFVFGIPLLYIGLTFGWLGAIGAVLGSATARHHPELAKLAHLPGAAGPPQQGLYFDDI